MEHDPFIHNTGEPVSFALVDADTLVAGNFQPEHSVVQLQGTDQFTGRLVTFMLDPPAIESLRTAMPPVMLMVPDYAIQPAP